MWVCVCVCVHVTADHSWTEESGVDDSTVLRSAAVWVRTLMDVCVCVCVAGFCGHAVFVFVCISGVAHLSKTCGSGTVRFYDLVLYFSGIYDTFANLWNDLRSRVYSCVLQLIMCTLVLRVFY